MELGFEYRQRKNGEVAIYRDGREVTVLRGKAASRFLMKIELLDESGMQQLMARVTGQYKMGNE